MILGPISPVVEKTAARSTFRLKIKDFGSFFLIKFNCGEDCSVGHLVRYVSVSAANKNFVSTVNGAESRSRYIICYKNNRYS